MKLLGFIYKIPLGNILGDEGYSMFTSAYSIYFIFFTLATAGLPVALSRLIAEADANGRAKQEEKTFRVALATFAVIGVIFALILFLFPEWLAAKYLENPDAALSIKAMAPSILLVCLVSAYRGYCQGNGNMIPTTVDEVLEVLFKVISGLILASCLLKAGFGKPVGSAGAILGVSIGSVISLLYMIIYKRRHYSELSAPYTAGIHDPNDTPDDDEVVDSAWKIVKDILSIGIPIAFGACIMAILNSVDSKLCMNRLQSAAGFLPLSGEGTLRRIRQGADALQSPCGFHNAAHDSDRPGDIRRYRQGRERRCTQDLGGRDAHLRRHQPADGRGAHCPCLPDNERPLPQQQRRGSGTAGNNGRGFVLCLHGADGKRHSPGLRA